MFYIPLLLKIFPIQLRFKFCINLSGNPLSRVDDGWKWLKVTCQREELHWIIWSIDWLTRGTHNQWNLPFFVTHIPTLLLPSFLPLPLSQFNLHFTIYLIGLRMVASKTKPNPSPCYRPEESTGLTFLSWYYSVLGRIASHHPTNCILACVICQGVVGIPTYL